MWAGATAQLADAVALFVNVAGPPGRRGGGSSSSSSPAARTYANAWLCGGRRLTWFAQPGQGEASPAVARLLSGAVPVVLFCREEGRPYVYCGRLSAHSFHPAAAPGLKVVWRLDEFEAVRRGEGWAELGVGGGGATAGATAGGDVCGKAG